MKRLLNIAGGLLGLLALGALMVALALFFSGQRRETRLMSGVFQSPIETPTRPLKPTPVTPPATIPPKPSPPVQPIATTPPYPPPQTPTPSGTPTLVPTPRATVTPTPAVTVVPGPLPPGLKIVCVDQGADEQTSVIWIANVDDLDHVQVIATLRNLFPGLGPLGQLSPDGRWMAYVLPRKHYTNSVLGVVNIDGSGDVVLDDPVDGPGVDWLLRWSPDSRWIAYVRRMPPRPESERSQIWLIDPDGSGKRLLVPEVRAPLLIGWSRDSSQLYYTPGGRDLWAVGVDGQPPPFVLLHFDEPAAPFRLSPDGGKIIYEVREPRPAAPMTLGVASIDGRERYVLAEGINSYGFAFENYILSPIWSPDSSRVIYNAPVDRTHIELLAIQWNNPRATVAIRDREAAYYKPMSWSPDSRLIVAWRYPLNGDPDSKIHLVLIGLDGSLRTVHGIKPDSPLPAFVGWVEDGQG